jgi:sugar phosphate isomerase/epimerase
MDDRLLSLAAGTILEVAPAAAVDVAAAAGFPAVGIWFDPAQWTPRTTAVVRGRLDRTGLVALDVEPVILTPDGDPGDLLVDAAGDLGARHVLVASRQPDRPRAIERFGALCDRAAPAGVTVVLEFLPIMAVRTLGEALSLVADAGRPNGAVLVDTLHLARSGGVPSDLGAVDPSLLPYLQVADAPSSPPDPSMQGLVEEALHGRCLPGEGALPIAEVLAAVPGVPLSFELRSRRLREEHPDPRERASAVLAAAHRLRGA